MREREQDQQLAKKRAAALADMDSEFQTQKKVRKNRKPPVEITEAFPDVRITHDFADFAEDQEQILVLKDAKIGDEDELENVQMVEDERVKVNLLNRSKPHKYDPLEDPEEELVLGERKILSKYDQVIDGGVKKKVKETPT